MGATEVREQWIKAGRGRWHETYVKYTKSFVRVGAPRDDGKPAVGLSVAAVTTGGTVASTQVTDGEGHVTFQLGKAGPWLIKAIRILPSSNRLEW